MATAMVFIYMKNPVTMEAKFSMAGNGGGKGFRQIATVFSDLFLVPGGSSIAERSGLYTAAAWPERWTSINRPSAAEFEPNIDDGNCK